MVSSGCPYDPHSVPEPELPSYLAAMPSVREFADVRTVFTSKDFRQGGHELSADFIGGTLVNLEGREHRARLRQVRPLFSRESLLRYEQAVLIPAVDDILGRLTPDEDGWIRADLVPLARRILTRIAAAVLGLDDVEPPERTDRLVYFEAQLAAASRLQFAVGDRDAMRQQFLVDKADFIDEFVAPSRKRREELIRRVRSGEATESDLPLDLLTILLLNEATAGDDDLLNREVILFLVGSTLTTAMSTPHAVYHVSNWLAEHPEDRDFLLTTEGLRAAAYESMRLHASSPAQIRRSSSDVTLPDGRELGSGTNVAVVTTHANRCPAVYGEEPDRYDPHRSVGDAHMELYGHTFAEGAHRCLGEYLAAGLRPLPGKDEGTQGMVIRILSALIARDVRPDPERSAQIDPSTMADFFVSFPILFRPEPVQIR